MGKHNAQSGFTLLELLVAIIIFSLISIAGYEVLQRSMESKSMISRKSKAIEELQNTMISLQDDFGQLILREIRNERGIKDGAITTANQRYLVEFTRIGWNNPLDNKRSDLQRVSYSFRDNKLTRYFWPVLDIAENSTPIGKILISDLNSVDFLLLDNGGVWRNSWGDTLISPIAIKIIMKHKTLGSVEKIIQIEASVPITEM